MYHLNFEPWIKMQLIAMEVRAHCFRLLSFSHDRSVSSSPHRINPAAEAALLNVFIAARGRWLAQSPPVVCQLVVRCCGMPTN
jgi:hypothetical protein